MTGRLFASASFREGPIDMEQRPIRHLGFRPPADLRAYPIPAAGVVRDDADALVAEVLVGGIVVRHYGFSRRWLAVNVSLDRSGRLVETPGGFGMAVAVKCHIATPMERVGRDRGQVDLWLDLCVRADGRTAMVEDEDEFETARADGLLSDREAIAAMDELARLRDQVADGALLPWLESFAPFGPMAAPEAPPVERLAIAEAPWLDGRRRRSW